MVLAIDDDANTFSALLSDENDTNINLSISLEDSMLENSFHRNPVDAVVLTPVEAADMPSTSNASTNVQKKSVKKVAIFGLPILGLAATFLMAWLLFQPKVKVTNKSGLKNNLPHHLHHVFSDLGDSSQKLASNISQTNANLEAYNCMKEKIMHSLKLDPTKEIVGQKIEIDNIWDNEANRQVKSEFYIQSFSCRKGPELTIKPADPDKSGRLYTLKFRDTSEISNFYDGWIAAQVKVDSLVPGTYHDLAEASQETLAYVPLFDGNVDFLPDSYLKNGKVYIFLEGSTLLSTMLEQGITIQQKELIAYQLSLAAVHYDKFGLNHCDLNPENIRVDRNGIVMMDAYIGKQAFNRGYFNDLYQRPGEKSSTSDNMYSLGVTLFKLFTGELPVGLHSGTTTEHLNNLAVAPLQSQDITKLEACKTPKVFIDLIKDSLAFEPKKIFTAEKMLQKYGKELYIAE